jgi:hypothetical protein
MKLLVIVLFFATLLYILPATKSKCKHHTCAVRTSQPSIRSGTATTSTNVFALLLAAYFVHCVSRHLRELVMFLAMAHFAPMRGETYNDPEVEIVASDTSSVEIRPVESRYEFLDVDMDESNE